MVVVCLQLNLGVRRMPKVFNVTAVVIFTALCASCGEVQSASYATYADAIAGGAQQRGWLPPFVPTSATDIREVHDLDSNTQWLRFRVPVGDTSVGTGAARISISEAASRAPKPPGAMGDWLPELRNPPLITRRSGIQAYRHSGHLGARCVAIVPSDGLAYAWTC
jgi:hypothetical protein